MTSALTHKPPTPIRYLFSFEDFGEKKLVILHFWPFSDLYAYFITSLDRESHSPSRECHAPFVFT